MHIHTEGPGLYNDPQYQGNSSLYRKNHTDLDPLKFAVIILKFQQHGFTIEKWVM